MRNIVLDAMMFAQEAHKDQKRKYTGDPYIAHPAEVAALVQAVGGTDRQIAAAWLHDVIEDCGVTKQKLVDTFGLVIANYVDDLSDVFKDPVHGNREVRKRKEADRLGLCESKVQTIKYADLISNTRSIVAHDHSFARVYLAEKTYALSKMLNGDYTLRNLALRVLREGDEALVQHHLASMNAAVERTPP